MDGAMASYGAMSKTAQKRFRVQYDKKSVAFCSNSCVELPYGVMMWHSTLIRHAEVSVGERVRSCTCGYSVLD